MRLLTAIARHTLPVVALLGILGCRKDLPGAPSELTSGIVVYEHANYLGASAHITADEKNLEDVSGPCRKFESGGGTTTMKEIWGDCISSVQVAPGWRAILYRDDDFDGDQLQVTADMPNLELAAGDCDKGGFNDCASSIRLVRP